jgi:hypothetical protein
MVPLFEQFPCSIKLKTSISDQWASYTPVLFEEKALKLSGPSDFISLMSQTVALISANVASLLRA